jgi:replicative DNA helicase
LLRSLIDAGTDILRDAYDAADEPRQLLSRAEEKIFAILERRTSAEAKPIQSVLEEVMVRMDARMRHEHTVGGVETGFTDLDSLCGGLHDSELVILAARPSMGKTAFAMNIAENVAINLKLPVLFVSLEMASIELADRLLCSASQVNGHRLRNGTISQEDRRRLVQKSSEIGTAPLFIDDTPSRTLTEIAAVARRLKRKQGLSLIVIDYLQLIEPDNPRDPRQEQVARIARRLKGMSRELDIPVLCLAQLNRQAEASRDNRPRLNHLRESGAIEQDADVVMFVHREEYYQTNDEDRERVRGQAEIIIAKQRNGPIGDIKLLWQHDFTRFVSLEHRPHDEFEQFSGTGF